MGNKKKYICKECGRTFTIRNYRYSSFCWRCRQKRALVDSTRSMKYVRDDNMYETNIEKIRKLINSADKEWDHISRLSNRKQEIALWDAVINSFERKYGALDNGKVGV